MSDRMSGRFDGKAALVTGAASGIGLATARAFAAAGAAVALVDRDEATVRGAADVLVAAGGQAIGLGCDVADEPQVAAMVDRVIAAFGRLDAAFNNAGIHVPVAETADASGEDFDRLMAVNLRGVWNCLKYELRQMRTQQSGAIVNCSSQSGLAGIPGLGAYTASKHAVIGLTRSAALEYAARGIRINAVCPGPIHTPMVAQAMANEPETMKGVIREVPASRLGTPEEVASAVLWLCGEGAGFTIGHALVVDGGFTVR